MGKYSKRILAMLLSLVLVLSLVPATVFATQTETVDYAAVNAATGATYASVSDACDEAQAGQTIQLTGDFEDKVIVVDEQITLDLAGFCLTAEYVACYGQIIDSSADTTGLLKVPANHLLLETNNPQLPVKDGDGYRFVEIIGYNTAMVNENKYAFQPLFEAAAHPYLAAGSVATGVTIQVDVSWLQDGQEIHAQFAYSDELLTGYINSYKPATGKYGKMFTLTKQSTGYYANLGFEAVAVSDTEVRIGAGVTRPEQPEQEGKVEVDSENKLVNDVTVQTPQGSATIQAGTQLENASAGLKLTTSRMDKTGTDLTLDENETLDSFDIHVSGIAKENTVPVIITLNKLAPEFLNKGNLELYHVENGETVPMTRVYTLEEVDAHNEYYYDIITGTVTVAMSSFSEVAVASTEPKWEYEYDFTWYDKDPDADVFYIANADQLAGLSALVGGMAVKKDGKHVVSKEIVPDFAPVGNSFKGKTIKLLSDIDLNFPGEEKGFEKSFYPIGYYNSDGTYYLTSKAITSSFNIFEGTFDGHGHTIKGIYQRTWDMKGDNNYYAAANQYYRDGMGLFGKVYGGTVKNLTIRNFQSDGEYTTTGCVAAYADCGATFENISIFDCNPRVYNIGNGGIVGCVGWYARETAANPVTFKNITVDNSNKISALWGSWDVPCGGIVGQYYPTSGQSYYNYPANPGIHFENCHVSAQMDVYNDVCANYQYYAYRYAGILIGSVRENETVNGHVYPKMNGITAKDCTVHFGTWNDYYYCELVDNTTASYTHDYQMSRLTEIKAINGTTITYLDDTTGTVPASGRANYVIVDYTKGHGTENATCYHFLNGDVWTHEMGGIQTGIDENGDNQDDLREDKQHIYREFNNLVTGYGWGVTSKGVDDMEGVTILDRVVGDSEVKFNPTFGPGANFDTGVTMTLGELFEAAKLSDEKLSIVGDKVQVFVTPADENSIAGAIYTPNTTDWTQGTVKFTGHGAATIIIDDYYFCIPTSVVINILPAVQLELVSHPVNTYTDLNDTAHKEGTKVYVQITSDSELPLAAGSSVAVAVPDGWTFKSDIGTYTDGKLTVTNAQTVSKKNLVLGTFVVAQTDKDITNWTVDTAGLKIMGAKSAVPAVVDLTAQGEGHNGDEWIAWGDDAAEQNTLPTVTGRYYLTQNISLPNQVILNGESRNVELCLNGKTLFADLPQEKFGKDGYRDRVYYVRNGAKLTICDCSACGTDAQSYNAGKITGASHGAIMIPNLEKYVDEHGRTVVNLYDGIFAENTLIENGGCVLAQQYATFNMYGGMFKDNRNEFMGDEDSAAGQGAAIYAGNHGTVNIYGGWITNNVANKGAGVWCTSRSTINIKNGYFAGNSTWQDDTDRYMHKEGETGYTGEALATKDIYFTYNPDDKAYHYGSGAAIYASSATLNVENTVFEENEAWIRGGAITLTGSTLNLVGGRFEANKALTYKYRFIAPETEETTDPVQAVAENETENNTTTNPDDELGGAEGETGGSTGGDGDMGEGETAGTYKIQESTGSGGAIFMHNASVLNVKGTTFTNNEADLNGGAVDVIGGATAVLEDAIITNNKINSNGGAGVYYTGYSKLTIQGNTKITGNYGGLEDRRAVAGVYLTNGYGEVTIKGNPVIDSNGYGTSPENIIHERNVYLQDNSLRTYDDDKNADTPEIRVPDAVVKIRNLTPGMNISVFNSGGKAIYPDISTWLDWKDTENFDPNDKESYYGTWHTSYIRLDHDTLKTEVIWENKDSYELYMLDNHDANHAPVEGVDMAWQPWFKTDALPTESGYYYLTADVTLAAVQQLSGAKNVNLCLRGHSITTNAERIYYVAGSAKLTICDCTVAVLDTETQTTLGTLYTGTGEGGAIKAESGTTVNLTNIKVTGLRADGTQIEEVVNGGAIYASNATVNITDVLFTNVRVMGKTTLNVAEDKGVHVGRGGVIFAGAATKMTMTNVIIDNCSGGMGAVLYFDGTVNKATLTMNNVTIQNCEADAAKYESNEENVLAKPKDPAYSEILHLDDVTATMNQCRILNNTTWDSLRGPVYLCINTVVTMTDCTITGNRILNNGSLTAENYGAIYMTQPAKLILNGNNNVIADNYHYTYDTATGDAADCKREINIFLQTNGDANKYPYVQFKNITDTTYQAKIDASYSFSKENRWNTYWSAENCVSFAVFQTYSGSTGTKANYTYLYDGTTFVKLGSTHPTADYHNDDCADAQWKPWTNATTLPSASGHYYLTRNVSVTKRVELTKDCDITICLNGYTISYGGSEETGVDKENYNSILYYLKDGKINLTICDCTATGDTAQGIYNAETNPNGYKAGTISGFTDCSLFTPSSGKNENITINICDVIFTNNVNDTRDVEEKGTNTTYAVGSQMTGGVIIAQAGVSVNITGGLFINNGASGSAGVIYSDNSNITVSNTVFSENTARVDGGVIRAGASTVVLNGCTFADNTANTGGGVMAAVNNSKVTATNCAFARNEAKDYGGAIHGTGTAELYLTNCTFAENTAKNNGGAINTASTVVIKVNGGSFTGNTAGVNGGAIFTSNSDGIQRDTLFEVNGTVFKGNKSCYGGAIYAKYRTNIALNGCTFTDNAVAVYTKSDKTLADGLGGAICTDTSALTITDGSFDGNTAERSGGAIYVTSTALTISGNCSITGNSAGSAVYYAGKGGGIFVDSNAGVTLAAGVVVENNTLVDLADGTAGLGKDLYLAKGASYTNNGAQIGDVYPPQTSEGGEGESTVQPGEGEGTENGNNSEGSEQVPAT